MNGGDGFDPDNNNYNQEETLEDEEEEEEGSLRNLGIGTLNTDQNPSEAESYQNTRKQQRINQQYYKDCTKSSMSFKEGGNGTEEQINDP